MVQPYLFYRGPDPGGFSHGQEIPYTGALHHSNHPIVDLSIPSFSANYRIPEEAGSSCKLEQQQQINSTPKYFFISF
jgi:hypothetical protein